MTGETARTENPGETGARADAGRRTPDNLFHDPDAFFIPHPAGLDFPMADGSVMFIKSSITPAVHGDIAGRDRGELVGGDGY